MNIYRVKVGNFNRKGNFNQILDFVIETNTSEINEVNKFYKDKYSGFDVKIENVKYSYITINKEEKVEINQDSYNSNIEITLREDQFKNKKNSKLLECYELAEKFEKEKEELEKKFYKEISDILNIKIYSFSNSLQYGLKRISFRVYSENFKDLLFEKE